jgi:selenocysteine lyase/cysteine desulfurase
MDHNSVLRPLQALQKDGVTHTIVQADPETGLVDPTLIADAITSDTRLIAVVHGSNVTGTVQDISAIGAVCGDIPVLVYSGQTMGHAPLDIQSMGIDLLAFPGHKGLLGPLGTGGLIMQKPIVDILEPSRFGGTGSASEDTVQPSYPPDKYESGSHNMLGIVGLEASLKWILTKGVGFLHNHEMQLCEQFLDEMKEVSNVRISGPQTTENRCGVFSLVFEQPPEISARYLEHETSVQCRAGLHCAPLAHKTMGTDQNGGSVRVSFGPFHTPRDISFLVQSIKRCAQPALV